MEYYKNIRRRWINVIAISVMCLFSFTAAYCANVFAVQDVSKITLSPETQLTQEIFKEKFQTMSFLLAHPAVNRYIRGQIEKEKTIFKERWMKERVERFNINDPYIRGNVKYDIEGMDSIVVVKVAGLLAHTGQFAHVGLSGRDYGGITVAYVDSVFYGKADNALLRHEVDEALQWEHLRTEILGLKTKQEMRDWIKSNIDGFGGDVRQHMVNTPYENCVNSREIAKVIHGSSFDIRELYALVDIDEKFDHTADPAHEEIAVSETFAYDYIIDMFALYGGNDTGSDINISAVADQSTQPDKAGVEEEMRSKTDQIMELYETGDSAEFRRSLSSVGIDPEELVTDLESYTEQYLRNKIAGTVFKEFPESAQKRVFGNDLLDFVVGFEYKGEDFKYGRPTSKVPTEKIPASFNIAYEKGGGLVGRLYYLKDVKLRYLDAGGQEREVDVPYLLVQEKLVPLGKKIQEIERDAYQMGVEAARDLINDLMVQFIEIHKEMYRRGFRNWDVKISVNYGVTRDNKVVLLDTGGIDSRQEEPIISWYVSSPSVGGGMPDYNILKTVIDELWDADPDNVTRSTFINNDLEGPLRDIMETFVRKALIGRRHGGDADGGKWYKTQMVPVDADIDTAICLCNKLFPASSKSRNYYDIRYDNERLGDHQNKGEISAASVISAYVDLIRMWTDDPDSIQILKNPSRNGVEKPLISIKCYSDPSKSEDSLIGEGQVNIEGDISGRSLRIIGMLNMALSAATIPNDAETGDYANLVSFIKRQFKDITGQELEADDLLRAIRYIELPKSEPIPAESISDYYRLTVRQLQQAA